METLLLYASIRLSALAVSIDIENKDLDINEFSSVSREQRRSVTRRASATTSTISAFTIVRVRGKRSEILFLGSSSDVSEIWPADHARQGPRSPGRLCAVYTYATYLNN
jgi:hypothetical protein